jgi:hypothetical protein
MGGNPFVSSIHDSENLSQYVLRFLEDPLIGKSQDPEPQGTQVNVAVFIVSHLPRFRVDLAVELDDQPETVAVKISHERSDRNLAAELEAAEVAAAQKGPETRLGGSLGSSELLRANPRGGSRRSGPHPDPLPALHPPLPGRGRKPRQGRRYGWRLDWRIQAVKGME